MIQAATKEKIDHIREHANDKAENENKYLFKKLENQYQKKVDREKQEEIKKRGWIGIPSTHQFYYLSMILHQQIQFHHPKLR